MSEELPTRWELELEFVQSLANPRYVNYLAQTGQLQDEKLVNYLEYLQYWEKPEYAKHLVFPDCLHVLRLLQSAQFRQSISTMELTTALMNEMVERWKSPGSTFAASPLQNIQAQGVVAFPVAPGTNGNEAQPPVANGDGVPQTAETVASDGSAGPQSVASTAV